jgi:adenosylcobinamide kinase / adenosylcobinamide-phosphate guanylyltransferase
MMNRVRTPTAALLGEHILIDAGPTASSAIARAGRSFRSVHHIVVTHAHPDHWDPSILLWLQWNPPPHTVHVWGPHSVIDTCSDWIGPTNHVQAHALVAEDEVRLPCPDGDWLLEAVPAHHDPHGVDAIAAEAMLFDVSDPSGERLLYATDTGPFTDTMLAQIARITHRRGSCRFLLIEETFGDRYDHGTGHLDLQTLPSTLTALRATGAVTEATDVVAIHLGHHNPVEDQLRARLQAMGVSLHADGTYLGRNHRVLITGGARSGKSREAEARALPYAQVTYLATAPRSPDDLEWEARIAAHRDRRPAHWQTREGHDLVVRHLREAQEDDFLLVDCLTLWLTGVLDEAANGQVWDDIPRAHMVEVATTHITELCEALAHTRANVVLVSNEVGSGVIAPTRSGRLFTDLLGALNQQVAQCCDETILMVAGRIVPTQPRRGTTVPLGSVPVKGSRQHD